VAGRRVQGARLSGRSGGVYPARQGGGAAVATYDPRLGAVVVASHSPECREGQILDVKPEAKA
uniref:CRISPR-associated protein Csx3 n=1 Tax=Pyramidobacter piscolens TaxID=638849 RepID=UPI0024931F72